MPAISLSERYATLLKQEELLNEELKDILPKEKAGSSSSSSKASEVEETKTDPREINLEDIDNDNLIPKSQEQHITDRKRRIDRKKKFVKGIPIPTAIGTKQAGNIAFKKQDYELAIIWYTEALKKLGSGSTY